jgi:hypothetical protein
MSIAPDTEDSDASSNGYGGIIVGLWSASNGRKCMCHDKCGMALTVDSIIRLKSCFVTIRGLTEPAIKAVWIRGGEERCTVGFLPRNMAFRDGAENDLEKYAQILALLHKSEDEEENAYAFANMGAASFAFLDNIPSLE